METNLRTLGPKETKVILSFREQGREIVHAADIIGLLGSEPTARKVIRNLLRKGWLTRLVGGRYMVLPPEHGPENLGENNPIALAAAAAEPSYVGWWSAAAFHGFTTQKPMTVTVAVLRQMPARTIEGTEVRFVKIAPRKFSGFKSYEVYGRNARDLRPREDRCRLHRPSGPCGRACRTRAHRLQRDGRNRSRQTGRRRAGDEIDRLAPAARFSHRPCRQDRCRKNCA